jgi:hypothetical protein
VTAQMSALPALVRNMELHGTSLIALPVRWFSRWAFIRVVSARQVGCHFPTLGGLAT